jgi:hypothetical protein
MLRLAHASQQESPRYRGIRRARKIRMQLGGGASLLDPFPPKSRRMHGSTYGRYKGEHTSSDAFLSGWRAVRRH